MRPLMNIDDYTGGIDTFNNNTELSWVIVHKEL